MTELSEQYISLRGEVQGKKRLDADVVNPLLREYRKMLESFKIKEKKDDGGRFQVGVVAVDEFNYELLSEKIALFSHQLKLNVFDSFPHSHNNYQHFINVKITEGLQKIKLDNRLPYTKKIVIVTTGIKFSGSAATGRWPAERMAGIGI